MCQVLSDNYDSSGSIMKLSNEDATIFNSDNFINPFRRRPNDGTKADKGDIILRKTFDINSPLHSREHNFISNSTLSKYLFPSVDANLAISDSVNIKSPPK